MLRAGLVGLGQIGRIHARVLSQLEGVEFVAACDSELTSTDAAPGVEVVSDLESLLERELDLCVVATPTTAHERMGLALAEAGVNALIEKPLADDSLACRRLCDAFADEQVIGCVGHVERFNPAIVALKEELAEGAIGEVFQIATTRQGPFPERIRDVGVIMDLATHDIDLTRAISAGDFASVSARTAHRSGRDHEDLVAVTARLGDGTVTNHLVNWLTPTKERRTMVTGEGGVLVADTLTADLYLYRNGVPNTDWQAISVFRGVSEGDMVRFALNKREPIRTELEAFRDAVLGVSSNLVTLEDGLEAVRVGEALQQSAATGTTVELA